MKVIILGGFLGSGKTSVLLQLAKHIVGDQPVGSAKVVILPEQLKVILNTVLAPYLRV